eukprot:CFRG5376T1
MKVEEETTCYVDVLVTHPVEPSPFVENEAGNENNMSDTSLSSNASRQGFRRPTICRAVNHKRANTFIASIRVDGPNDIRTNSPKEDSKGTLNSSVPKDSLIAPVLGVTPSLPSTMTMGRRRGRSATINLKDTAHSTATLFPSPNRRRFSGQSVSSSMTNAGTSFMTPVRRARNSISKKLGLLGGKPDSKTCTALLSAWEMEGKLAGKTIPTTDTDLKQSIWCIAPNLCSGMTIDETYSLGDLACIQLYYQSQLDECFKYWDDEQKPSGVKSPKVDKKIGSSLDSGASAQGLITSLLPIENGVPIVLQDCRKYIEATKERLYEEGLFRKNCNTARLREVSARLNRGESLTDILTDEASEVGIHEVTGLYKSYFRLMPEPLLPTKYFHAFIHVNAFEEHSNLQKLILHRLISMLPRQNQQLLQHTLTFLNHISQYAMYPASDSGKPKSGNMMSANNLAIVMGPNILRSPLEKIQDHAAVTSVTQILIQNCQDLFTIPGNVLSTVGVHRPMLKTPSNVTQVQTQGM